MQKVPKIIEKDGKKLAVLAFTDLDGTVNNQDIPEKDRLATIDPAKEAIAELQAYGIPVGAVTARSFGETLIYQKALNAEGFTITEDGTVVILPGDIKLEELSQKKHIVSHDGESALIISTVELETIKDFIQHIIKELKERSLPSDLTTTCFSTPELLKEMIHYQTVDDAIRASDRLASAFVRDATEEQYKLMIEQANEWKMRITGDAHHFHLLGKDADKGIAIQFIHDNARLFLPDADVDGIIPIVFGNDYNDIRLFEEAHAMGGLGIIVKNSKGGYRVPTEKIPSYVIKTEGGYGYGMKEALEAVFKELDMVS